MASNQEVAREVGYPKLTRKQMDLVIDQLVFVMRQRDLGTDQDEAEALFAYLTSFYTKRWGLPRTLTSGLASVAGLPGRR